jgi:dUTP pyrophosphatase
MATLYIQPLSTAFEQLYTQAAQLYNSTPEDERNSGFDLYCDQNDVNTEYSNYASLVGQGCKVMAVDDDGDAIGWWLAPRSSISRTPYRLANSLGLMDPTYRGVVRAALTHLETHHVSNPEVFRENPRLVQAAAPSLRPWDSVVVVSVLPGEETERGEEGFGSTGR